MVTVPNTLKTLHELITQHFSLEEFRTLCFDLGQDYDRLRGEEKSGKARELIVAMLCQDRLVELVSTLQDERPKVEWPKVHTLSFEERLAWTTASEPLSAADYLASVREYCSSLPYLSLHDIRPLKTLDEVYVPLRARAQPLQPQKREPNQYERGPGQKERRSFEVALSAPVSIADVMRRPDPPHVLILGEPGAGKSTLLRQMAECAWDAPAKIGLEGPCLPLLVPLRRLAALDGSLEARLKHALTGELALVQDLQEGFFTRWSEQTGTNWLLLLDALDEVPAELHPRLMDWLKRILKTAGPSRIVITSRPSGYLSGELDDNLFGHYDLLPFTPEQAGEFALRWFDQDQTLADRFLQELDRVRARALRGTPLLLTIAAKVYLEKGTLPERRSALYDQFVSIWLAQAEQRGLRGELENPVCDLALRALARLALTMTEQPAQSESTLGQIAADYLQTAIPLPADRAKVVGARFVRVMAKHSGVFVRQGDDFDFVHPTFREYLAAWAVVQECKQDNGYDLDRVWRRVVSRWNQKAWHEPVLFALGMLSDDGQDVTGLVKRVWRKGIGIFSARRNEEALAFAATALAEPVKVEASQSESIIDALLAAAKSQRRRARSSDALECLVTMQGYPRAHKGLLALARDEKVYDSVRVSAARALGESGRADEAAPILLALARDKKVHYSEREWAAEELVKLGRADEALPILLALARDEKVDGSVRVSAAKALVKLGRADEAAPILLALARDEKVDSRVRERAAEALVKLGRADDLLALARDEKVYDSVRVSAAKPLGELGRADEAAPILLALARDKKVHYSERERAAEALVKLGRADEAASVLLALACDEKIYDSVRVSAAAALVKLGRADEAAPILLALARDKKVHYSEREWAAEALVKLERADDLLALARDKKAHGGERACAAEALGRLGHADEAVSILLALVRDKKVDSFGRARAAEALAKLGRADEAAPILMALARDKRLDFFEGARAAKALAELGRADDLLALARDKKAHGEERACAAEALGRLGQVDEAASVLLALARAEKGDSNVRAHAAKALVELERADDLLALARDEKVVSYVRALAAEELRSLRRAKGRSV